MAEGEYNRILKETLKSHGENHLNVLNCYENKALIAKKKNQYETAVLFYKKSINLANHLSKLEQESLENEQTNQENEKNSKTEKFLIDALIQMSDVKRKKDDLDGAERDYLNALLKPNLSENQKFNVHRGLGLICKKKNLYDDALHHYHLALDIKSPQIQLNKYEFDLGILYTDLGQLFFFLLFFFFFY